MSAIEVHAAVIGGGPAGSAAAAILARAGRPVAVIEREPFPREKLCGEFLSPECAELFAELGVLDAVEAQGPACIRRVRIFDRTGRPAAFELPRPGYGLRRSVLDAILLEAAREAGARVVQPASARVVEDGDGAVRLVLSGSVPGTTGVCSEVRAGCAVSAAGRLEVRGRLEPGRKPAAIGVRGHFRMAGGPAGRKTEGELAETVELHLFEGGYCGIAPIGGSAVNVCALVRGSAARGARASGARGACAVLHALAERSVSLRRRLAALEPAGAEQAIAVPSFRGLPAAEGRVFRAGDALGPAVPFFGCGVAAAVATGMEAGRLLASLPERPGGGELARAAAFWRRQVSRTFALRRLLARFLQCVLLSRSFGSTAALAAARRPGVARLILAATRAHSGGSAVRVE